MKCFAAYDTFQVHCNALLKSFIVCDFYKVLIWFFPTSFGHFHFHSTLELTCALILTLCVNFNLSLFSTAQTNTLSCTQFGMKLVSENITIMSEARDDPDVPQGNTVYTRAAEKNTAFWNISAIYRGWLYSLGTRSAAVIWKGSQL